MKEDSVSIYSMMPEIEKLLIEKYVRSYNIDYDKVTRGVQFVGADPIMDKSYVYDAYYAPMELFIEVTRSISIAPYKLYYALSKLYHYRMAKNNNAKMILLIPLLPEKNKYRDPSNRFYETFSSAIRNNLLDIKTYDVTEKEFEEIKIKSKTVDND